MKFDEYCDLLNGVYKENWHGQGMVCLVPKESVKDAFNVDSCEEMGFKEIANKNNVKEYGKWYNMTQFGRPDITGFCKIRLADMNATGKNDEFNYIKGLFIAKTVEGDRKIRDNWMELSNKEKEDIFLSKGGRLSDVPSALNYIPTEPFFYTEVHESIRNDKYFAPQHTHINFEGDQLPVYSDIVDLLKEAGIKVSLTRVHGAPRIKIWASKHEIPFDLRKKIYHLVKNKYHEIRMGNFIE